MSVHDHLHDQQPKRPYSIDLTLELERQLEDESLPSTPATNLDPQVLASIVISVTKERDNTLKLLSEANTRETQLRDSLRHVTENCAKLEHELEETRRKMKDDEDAITMLRTKVEESRRGLMRLQTENRRASQGPSDMSWGGIPSFGGPASSKRASFSPLTGSGASRPNTHRRISSVSDSSLMFSDHGLLSPSSAQPCMVPDSASLSSGHPPISSRRFSGLFAHGTPSELELPVSPDILSSELASVRRELQAAKARLDEMGHELTESNDARQASQACVETLREFIAHHNVGVRPDDVELANTPMQQPPARNTGEETAKPGTGWGFKLWKVDTLMSSGPPMQAISPLTTQTSEPLSKKIGGFFSSRASISSSTTPSYQQPLSSSYAQEPMYNASDTSSISLVEPVSPTNEGTGSDIDVISSQSVSPDMTTVKIHKQLKEVELS